MVPMKGLICTSSNKSQTKIIEIWVLRMNCTLCYSRTVQSAAAAALALLAAFYRNSTLSQGPEHDGGEEVEVVAGRYFLFLI